VPATLAGRRPGLRRPVALVQIFLSVCFCLASGFAGFKRPGPGTAAQIWGVAVGLKCVFNRLGLDVLNRIAALHLGKTVALLNAQGHEITCEPAVVGHVRRTGYSEEFSALARSKTRRWTSSARS
jgi:hypothetical protein